MLLLQLRIWTLWNTHLSAFASGVLPSRSSPLLHTLQCKLHDKVAKWTYSTLTLESESGQIILPFHAHTHTLVYCRRVQHVCESQNFMLAVMERWMLHWACVVLKYRFESQIWGLLFPLDLWKARIISFCWSLPSAAQIHLVAHWTANLDSHPRMALYRVTCIYYWWWIWVSCTMHEVTFAL